MNHITRLLNERDHAQSVIRQLRDELRELEIYLASEKFHGPDNDYVHVRTDIGPKIARLRFMLCGE